MGLDEPRGFLGKDVIGGLADGFVAGDALQLLEAPGDHDVATGRVFERDFHRRAVHDCLEARRATAGPGTGWIATRGGFTVGRQNRGWPAVALDDDRCPVPGQTIHQRLEVDRAVRCGRCRHMDLFPATCRKAWYTNIQSVAGVIKRSLTNLNKCG